MSTTVHVQGISHQTTEKEVKDFFSFCGKITNLSITPVSSDADAQKSATVTFEKETAAKTALLLDNTQLGKSQVHVSTASNIDQVATQAGSVTTSAAQAAEDHGIAQEDKPRSRIVAEYLAHGYTLSDNVIQKAITLDSKHGVSSRFTNALQNFDSKYKVTDKAQGVDNKYQVSNKAMSAWGGLNSYFEKAMGTPTGQRIRDFYVQGEKQVTDVHNEARRLADLNKGTQEPHPVAGDSGKTACSCGGAEGVCGCAPGKCTCANCGKSDDPSKSVNPPQQVKGTEKTVCTCGGKDGVCGCEPGKCACASCGKSSSESVTEAKEAAQASGQSLPKETFGTTA
ncbi:Protein vip1 [Knufia obscura]|uniref:Protein vip1 n=1 Tax=Knufia obscura TaxID=1635080 RepID=A0ABR0RGV2_9EURO|nr:Protein vip1 [Knufia obscura]